MYKFALTPKWIVGHLLAITLVGLFIAAGFWQLSRHQWRADLNDRLDARVAEPAITNDTLGSLSADELDLRRAELVGQWEPNDILIWSQSLDGQAGCNIVTILDLSPSATGTGPDAVVVNRGWMNLAQCEQDDRSWMRPDSVEVSVTGQLRASQEAGRFQSDDPSAGVLESMLRVDVARIASQTDADVAEVYLALVESRPSEVGLVPIPPPTHDSGPHLGYAGQWFLFAGVGLIGYPLVLRRQARAPELLEQ